MVILNGKTVAEQLMTQLKQRVDAFFGTQKRYPNLKVILVGNDPASEVYVKNKHIACQKIGMGSEIIHLAENESQKNIENLIIKLNQDEQVDGILVQLPLPVHLDSDKIINTIDHLKDPDGLTVLSTGLLWVGKKAVSPCTPNGIIKMLDFYNIPLVGKKCLVIGRSNIVGKPMVNLLLERHATVTIAHSKTVNLKELISFNDVIIVAVGKEKFLSGRDFNSNHIVIDVGMHRSPEGLCGDVDYQSSSQIVKAMTPVPGGVGPMTIVCLLENTILLAEKSARYK